jgi:serine/threonine protein kinase
LKPDNIMFVSNDEDSKLKIVDFGFAHRQTNEETVACFTIEYAAPESLVKGPTNYGRDIWSLGAILYAMLCGTSPFMPQHINKESDDARYRKQLAENIRKETFNTSCDHWETLSSLAKNLISALLKNENERLSLDEVLQHPWMTETEDISSSDNNEVAFLSDINAEEEDDEVMPIHEEESEARETMEQENEIEMIVEVQTKVETVPAIVEVSQHQEEEQHAIVKVPKKRGRKPKAQVIKIVAPVEEPVKVQRKVAKTRKSTPQSKVIEVPEVLSSRRSGLRSRRPEISYKESILTRRGQQGFSIYEQRPKINPVEVDVQPKEIVVKQKVTKLKAIQIIQMETLAESAVEPTPQPNERKLQVQPKRAGKAFEETELPAPKKRKRNQAAEQQKVVKSVNSIAPPKARGKQRKPKQNEPAKKQAAEKKVSMTRGRQAK